MSLVLFAGCAAAIVAEKTISEKDLARLKEGGPSAFHTAVVVFKRDLLRSEELPADESSRIQTEKRLFLERTRAARGKLENLVAEGTARQLLSNHRTRWYSLQITAAGAASFADWAERDAPELGMRLKLLESRSMVPPIDDPRDVKGDEFHVGYASKDKLTAILRSGALLKSVAVRGRTIRGRASKASLESLRKAGAVGTLEPDEVGALSTWMRSWEVHDDAPRRTVRLLDSKVLERVSGRKWKVTVLSVGDAGDCVVAGADAAEFAKAAAGDSKKRTGAEKLQMIPDISNPRKNE